eukprot:3080334-Prorocentrum_lima.AAC.1
MTSSLVGSEMCIRDRVWVGSGPDPAPHGHRFSFFPTAVDWVGRGSPCFLSCLLYTSDAADDM